MVCVLNMTQSHTSYASEDTKNIISHFDIMQKDAYLYEKLKLLKIRILHHADAEKKLHEHIEQIHSNIIHLCTALTLADRTLCQTQGIVSSIISQCSTQQNEKMMATLTCKLHDVNCSTRACLSKISLKIHHNAEAITLKRKQMSTNAASIQALNAFALDIHTHVNTLALNAQKNDKDERFPSFLHLVSLIESLVNGIEYITHLSLNNASKMETITTKMEALKKTSERLSLALAQ